MLDADRVATELYEMEAAPPDLILQRAVQRIHASGAPFDWVGIYLLDGDHLVLHSYIGRATDLTRISVGQSVPGAAVAQRRDINVPDIFAFHDYLARDSETRSELAVLIRQGDRILGLIDVDSATPGGFAERDQNQLRHISDILGELVGPSLRQD